MKFSLCGKYLATAGKSGVLLVWEVLPKKLQDNSMKASAKDTVVMPVGSDLRHVRLRITIVDTSLSLAASVC